MLINYYTLRALANEWDPRLRGAVVADAYSQTRDELTLHLEHGEAEHSVHVRLDNTLRCVYRRHEHAKARRNVASVLDEVVGRRVVTIRVAPRDRHLFFDLEGALSLQITPFGPRPNVYVVGEDRIVRDAFVRKEDAVGRQAPEIRSIAVPATAEDLRWPSDEQPPDRALMRSLPLLDRTLSHEVLVRAAIDPDAFHELQPEQLRTLWTCLTQIVQELRHPAPRIYTTPDERRFSLIPLRHLGMMPCDVYDSVDEAVRAFVRSYLAERAFFGRREPIRRKLTDELERLERGLMQMQEELSAESRADRFERWAHVLMAQPNAVPRGADEAILPDVFEAGSHVRIPLDPAFSALENAQRFYDRARRTRAAREHASDRAVGLAAQQESLGQALRELEAVGDLPSMREFERRHVELLNRLTQTGRSGDAPSRFRTFRVAGGFEVLVGRNAAQNERLTFEVAAKHDVWLHARGTPGSHVVLRLPGPNQEPPRAALEEAASIAAHFSKASGSGLVPVVVTRRKHVRRARNAAPGTVIVEREEVLIVPPRLPSEDASADA